MYNSAILILFVYLLIAVSRTDYPSVAFLHCLTVVFLDNLVSRIAAGSTKWTPGYKICLLVIGRLLVMSSSGTTWVLNYSVCYMMYSAAIVQEIIKIAFPVQSVSEATQECLVAQHHSEPPPDTNLANTLMYNFLLLSFAFVTLLVITAYTTPPDIAILTPEQLADPRLNDDQAQKDFNTRTHANIALPAPHIDVLGNSWPIYIFGSIAIMAIVCSRFRIIVVLSAYLFFMSVFFFFFFFLFLSTFISHAHSHTLSYTLYLSHPLTPPLLANSLASSAARAMWLEANGLSRGYTRTAYFFTPKITISWLLLGLTEIAVLCSGALITVMSGSKSAVILAVFVPPIIGCFVSSYATWRKNDHELILWPPQIHRTHKTKIGMSAEELAAEIAMALGGEVLDKKELRRKEKERKKKEKQREKERAMRKKEKEKMKKPIELKSATKNLEEKEKAAKELALNAKLSVVPMLDSSGNVVEKPKKNFRPNNARGKIPRIHVVKRTPVIVPFERSGEYETEDGDLLQQSMDESGSSPVRKRKPRSVSSDSFDDFLMYASSPPKVSQNQSQNQEQDEEKIPLLAPGNVLAEDDPWRAYEQSDDDSDVAIADDADDLMRDSTLVLDGKPGKYGKINAEEKTATPTIERVGFFEHPLMLRAQDFFIYKLIGKKKFDQMAKWSNKIWTTCFGTPKTKESTQNSGKYFGGEWFSVFSILLELILVVLIASKPFHSYIHSYLIVLSRPRQR